MSFGIFQVDVSVSGWWQCLGKSVAELYDIKTKAALPPRGLALRLKKKKISIMDLSLKNDLIFHYIHFV